MAFQRVPETCEVAVLGIVQGITIQNTFHARRVGGYSEAQMIALAAAIDAVVVSDWLPIMAMQHFYAATVVRGLDTENDLEIEDSSGAGAGGISATPQPLSLAFSIRKLSGFTGRSARGRIYYPYLTTSQLGTDENFLQSSFANQMVSAVDAIRTEMAVEGWVPVIVSRYSGGAKRSEGVTFTWTSTSYRDLRLDTRRDRMPD